MNGGGGYSTSASGRSAASSLRPRAPESLTPRHPDRVPQSLGAAVSAPMEQVPRFR